MGVFLQGRVIQGSSNFQESAATQTACGTRRPALQTQLRDGWNGHGGEPGNAGFQPAVLARFALKAAVLESD